MTEAFDVVGGLIAWREAGSGPPVVFLHGLGGTRYAWEPQLEALARTHRCLAWDLPGYGDSAPIDPLTFPAITAAMVTWWDRLGLGRVSLVGLSFGGQQALHVALAHPNRVERLVLIDTSARFGGDGTDPDEWRRARLAPLDAGLTPADVAPQVVDAIAAPGFTGVERDRTIAAFARIPAAGLRAAVRCLPSHDVSDRLGEIVVPTTVVVGELDEETPVAYAEELVAGIGCATLHVIPGAGHLTPAEAPGKVNDLLVDALA